MTTTTFSLFEMENVYTVMDEMRNEWVTIWTLIYWIQCYIQNVNVERAFYLYGSSMVHLLYTPCNAAGIRMHCSVYVIHKRAMIQPFMHRVEEKQTFIVSYYFAWCSDIISVKLSGVKNYMHMFIFHPLYESLKLL